jgi:hypothetical protein
MPLIFEGIHFRLSSALSREDKQYVPQLIKSNGGIIISSSSSDCVHVLQDFFGVCVLCFGVLFVEQ